MNILKRARVAVVAAIVTFTVLAGTGVGYAYWSATAQATLAVGAGTLTSTATGWAATTLGNENLPAAGSISLTSTGSVTITNTTNTTSTQTETLKATFSRASGSAPLAAATTVTVWSVANAASCTTGAAPTSPTTGNWNTGITVSTPLAPNASVVYCIRNTVANRQSAADVSGTLTFTPQVAAMIAVGTNFTGGSTVSSTISTRYVYPFQDISIADWNYVVRATTTWCFDVSGSGTTDGSLLIAYACKYNADPNQDFRFMDPDGDGYGDFVPRHATNLRVAAAASTASGSAVDLRTASASATQQWQPQLIPGGTYQFVNKYSGLCLSLPATSAAVSTQVTCNGGADQKFSLTFRSAVQLTSLTCVNTGSGENRAGQFSWTADVNGAPYTVQARKGTSGAFATIGTTSATTYTVPGPGGAAYNGVYQVQILNADGQVVGTSNALTSTAQYEWAFFFQYNYARC